MASLNESNKKRPPSRQLDREILRLAIPSVMAAITVPLVGIADTALVGHLGPVAFIGAVSIGAMIFDALYWVFAFLRMGTTAIVAQAYGAGDDSRAGQTLLQSCLIALLLGTGLVLLRGPIMQVGLDLAGGTPEVRRWAEAYIEIRILAAPAVLLVFALGGFFRGMKDAITPLVVVLVVNGVNLIGDVILIHGLLGFPKLGVVGAGWASFLGASAGAVVGLVFLVARYGRVLGLGWSLGGMLRWHRLRSLLATQTHLFNRTMLLMAAYFLVVAVAARMGEVTLAANAVLLQLWYLAAYSMDGVAYASETLVGNALGAGERALTRALVWRTNLWGLGVGLLYGVVYLLVMPDIAAVFTSDSRVIQMVVGLTWLMAILQPINALAFVFDGVFIGANDTRFLSLQIAVTFLGVFLPVLFLLTRLADLRLSGLWMAMAVFSAARAVMLIARYRQAAWLDLRLKQAASP